MAERIFDTMQQNRFGTDYGSVVYWVRRCQSECTLVFLHGLTADHTLFERQVAYFEGRCNIFCWDAPAHGKSRPYEGFTYARAAENLKDILEKENLKNTIFIGQSMGGYIAQTYMKLYPDAVKAFVGIDTCPFGLDYYAKSDVWWLRQVEWMSLCFPHKLLVKSIAKSCTHTEAACQNMLTALQPYSKKELCHLMGIGFAGFLEENCDLEITCPTVILVGEHDRTGKVKQYCDAWHRKTRFPLYRIPDAAHNSNFDNSDVVNRIIESFVQDIRI